MILIRKNLFRLKNLCIVLTIIFLFVGLSLFAEWTDDPEVNTSVCTLSGEQAIPKLDVGPSGDVYVGYFSYEAGNYNVRLQRFDEAGNVQWLGSGLLVSDNTQMSWLTDWDITVDQDNHAIITFQDIRDGNNNVYAYRISPDGSFVWGSDGIALSNSTAFDVSPKVVVTSENNIVIAWGSDSVTRLQKINADGVLQWGSSGIEISGTNDYTWPQLLAVEDDNIIVKYFEDSGPSWAPDRHIYAQKFDADGNSVWAQPAAISTAGGITVQTQILPLVKDENNGFFIGWWDDRNSDMNYATYVQYVDSNGDYQFDTDGILTSINLNREHMYMYLAYKEDEHILYCYWNEMDADQNLRGIYGQKIDVMGTRKWEDQGRSIIEISTTNVYPFGIGNYNDGVVVFYEEGSEQYIKSMALDSNADFVWPDDSSTLCSVNSEKLHPASSKLSGSQWITTWGDDRNVNRDIYVQNVNTDGTLGYIPHSVQVQPNSPNSLIKINPNPLRELSTISLTYNANFDKTPKIQIYNVKGKLVKTLQTQICEKGFKINWDGKNELGRDVVNGVYFVLLKSDKVKNIGKILVLK